MNHDKKVTIHKDSKRGIHKGENVEGRKNAARLHFLRTKPLPLCGALLVRFLPTWAENEHKSTRREENKHQKPAALFGYFLRRWRK